MTRGGRHGLGPILILFSAVTGPAAAQEAVVDTSRPFVADAREEEQFLRGPVGWPTYQAGTAGELSYRFDPDGYARFGTTERLDGDYWEVACTPRPLDCAARRGPVVAGVRPDGRPTLALDDFGPEARFRLGGEDDPGRTAAELSAPAEASALLGAAALIPAEGGEAIPLDGLAAVAAYMRWVEAGQPDDLRLDADPRRPVGEAAPVAGPSRPVPASPATGEQQPAAAPAPPAVAEEGEPAASDQQAPDETPAMEPLPPPVAEDGLEPQPAEDRAAEAEPAAEAAPSSSASVAANADAGVAARSVSPPASPSAAATAPKVPLAASKPMAPNTAAATPAPSRPAAANPVPAPKAAPLADPTSATASAASNPMPAAAPGPKAITPASPEASTRLVPLAEPTATAAPSPLGSAANMTRSALTLQPAQPAATTAACTPGPLPPAQLLKPGDSLRALPGFQLVTDFLAEPAALKGKLRPAVRTLAEARLKAAGIRLLTAEEVEQIPGKPKLELYLTLGDAARGCPFRVWMSLRQEVALARDNSIHLITGTWGDGGASRAEFAKDAEVETFAYYIDRFIKDWQAAKTSQPKVAPGPGAAAPLKVTTGLPSGKSETAGSGGSDVAGQVKPPAGSAGDDPDAVFGIQTALRDIGYDVGTVDGRLGQRTRAAIRAFQRDHGLPVTGLATPLVLERLLARRTELPP